MLSIRGKALSTPLSLNSGSFVNPDLIYTSLSTTFKAVKSQKCHKHSSITITLSTPLTTLSLAWLSPLEPRVRHRDIGARRVDSIGAWLLETEEFRRWKNSSGREGSYHQTLFCDGNPGVGKSYIMYENT